MKYNNLVLLLSVSLVTGLVNGLLGVGGGTVLIPAMVLLMGVSQHQAHGTSLAVILPTTVASCIIYGLFHDLNFTIAVEVASGGILGGYLGAKLMNKIPAVRLRQFFGVFMFLAGLRMIF